MKDNAWSHVSPMCSYIARITRQLHTIALCSTNTRCLYSRGPRNHCPSRGGHPTCLIRKFRMRRTSKGGLVSGKPNLQRTQTGFEVSAGDWDLRPAVKCPLLACCTRKNIRILYLVLFYSTVPLCYSTSNYYCTVVYQVLIVVLLLLLLYCIAVLLLYFSVLLCTTVLNCTDVLYCYRIIVYLVLYYCCMYYYNTVLYCTNVRYTPAHYCTVLQLCCTVLYCTLLYYCCTTVLHYTAL